MTTKNIERLVYIAALVGVTAAAIGAIFTSQELETTLLMVSAVIAGLMCFDTSMERQLHSRWPWIFVSLAPVMKTVPAVWFELKADDGLLVERYDHAGSLLFGLCLLVAAVLLSRPAHEVGSDVSMFDGAVIVGAGLSAAAAGASVAFLFDRDFGTVRASRLLETPTWFVLGALLAAIALAAAHAPSPTWALTALLASCAVAAGLLAFTVAGGDVDRGWWALLFAGLAFSAGGVGPGRLGDRASRTRRSITGVVVAVLVGIVAAAAAISARSNPSSWGPGWAILGVLSLAMFALALASRPLDEPQTHTATGPQNIGTDRPMVAQTQRTTARSESLLDLQEVEAQALAKERALQTLRSAAVPAMATTPLVESPPLVQPQVAPVQVAPAQLAPAARVAEAPVVAQAVPRPMAPVPAPPPAPAAPAPASPAAASSATASAGTTATAPAALSDASLVASARAAAEVRDAPLEHRHDIAPLGQAHHFDPSTGLLSAAGLQQALAAAFATPRQAGHVTIMMFTIRDLDEIEETYGRLASAAVTREVAERVRTLLPAGTSARFARSAYSVVFVGDLGDPAETVQRLARVLLHLRAPLNDGVVGDKIDVVAGMAQCYSGEDVAEFVKRANLGLARAVQTVEPTFVAMP